MVERVAVAISDSSELSRAQTLLGERDSTIAALNERVSELESELAMALAALRAKELELNGWKQAPSMPVASAAPRPNSAHAQPARESNAAAPPPALTEPDKAGFPVLSRVSVALRESMSVPPPSRPDSVPPSRRREPRRACELELEFTDETHFYAGLTQDLSQGGVFIATYRVFPVGSRLELGFQLPDGTEVRARGVVRWVRAESEPEAERPGMGISFTELSEVALAAIAEFCRERAPLYMEF